MRDAPLRRYVGVVKWAAATQGLVQVTLAILRALDFPGLASRPYAHLAVEESISTDTFHDFMDKTNSLAWGAVAIVAVLVLFSWTILDLMSAPPLHVQGGFSTLPPVATRAAATGKALVLALGPVVLLDRVMTALDLDVFLVIVRTGDGSGRFLPESQLAEMVAASTGTLKSFEGSFVHASRLFLYTILDWGTSSIIYSTLSGSSWANKRGTLFRRFTIFTFALVPSGYLSYALARLLRFVSPTLFTLFGLCAFLAAMATVLTFSPLLYWAYREEIEQADLAGKAFLSRFNPQSMWGAHSVRARVLATLVLVHTLKGIFHIAQGVVAGGGMSDSIARLIIEICDTFLLLLHSSIAPLAFFAVLASSSAAAYGAFQAMVAEHAVNEKFATQKLIIRYICHEIRVPLNSMALGMELVTDSLGIRVRAGGLQDEGGDLVGSRPPSEASGGSREAGLPRGSVLQELNQRDDLRMSFEHMAGSISSMRRILDDVLNMNDLEQGAIELRDEPFLPISLVAKVCETFASGAQRKAIAVAQEFKSSLPGPDPQNVALVGDALRLSQVLGNLLSNALRFTRDGGAVTVLCTVRYAEEKRDTLPPDVAQVTDSQATQKLRRDALALSEDLNRVPSEESKAGIGARTNQHLRSTPATPSADSSVEASAISSAPTPRVIVRSSGQRCPQGETTNAEAGPRNVSDRNSLRQLFSRARVLPVGVGNDTSQNGEGDAPSDDHRAESEDSPHPTLVELTVTVQDSGIGIPAVDIPNLFAPFSHVTAGDQMKGNSTGLGLSISRAILDLHGGRIWAQSDGVGSGSRFTFQITLPVAPPGACQPSRQSAGSAGHLAANLARLHVDTFARSMNSGATGMRESVAVNRGADAESANESGSTSRVSPTPPKNAQAVIAAPMVASNDVHDHGPPRTSPPLVHAARGMQGPPEEVDVATETTQHGSQTQYGSGALPSVALGESALHDFATPRRNGSGVTHPDTQSATRSSVVRGPGTLMRLDPLPTPPSSTHTGNHLRPIAWGRRHSQTSGEGNARTGVTPPLTPRVRCLVVDDVQGNRLLLQRLLDRMGFETDVAVNGQDGLNRAAEILHSIPEPVHESDCESPTDSRKNPGTRGTMRRGPDLVVLMDGNMPVMDGITATRRLLRQYGSRIAVVGVTGNAHPDDRRDFLAAGALDLLTKPVSKAVLRKAISRAKSGIQS